MYRFIMSIGVSGLLNILKTTKYGDMLLGVAILVKILMEYMLCGSWQGCHLLGIRML